MSMLCVFNRTRDSFLSLRMIRAADVFARGPRLPVSAGPPHDGIWLESSAVIHTVGSTSAIDVLYLDASHRVVHLVEHLEPMPIMALPSSCHSLLELPARTIFGSHTEMGDQLVICAPEELGKNVGAGAMAA
jgi:hypothetical protein